MALTTGQREDINTASPINRKYSIGSRLTYMSTASRLSTPGDTGTYTTNYETSTSSATTLYLPYSGMYYCTGTGYYTIRKPETAGEELIILTRGTTDQFFRTASAGSGTTVCTIAHGTYTSDVVMAGSSHGDGVLCLKAFTTQLWMHMSGSGMAGSGFWSYATSS